jgi:hypothetical protein
MQLVQVRLLDLLAQESAAQSHPSQPQSYGLEVTKPACGNGVLDLNSRPMQEPGTECELASFVFLPHFWRQLEGEA